MLSTVVQVLDRPQKKDGQLGSTRAELEGASVALIQAAGLFTRLSHLPKAHLQARALKKEHISAHIKHCDKLTQRATALIDKVKAADTIRQVCDTLLCNDISIRWVLSPTIDLIVSMYLCDDVLQKQVEEQEQRTQIMREAAEVQRRMQAETERSKAAEREAALAEQQKLNRIRNERWMQEKAMNAVCFPPCVACLLDMGDDSMHDWYICLTVWAVVCLHRK